MAKTLLNGVNDVLKKVDIIDSNGLLTSLTDSGKQSFIDDTVLLWNEAIVDLYHLTKDPMPKQKKEDEIVLSPNVRSYDLATDLVELYWPLMDETNGRYISQYPGGYMALVASQSIPANYTGLPNYAVIDPENNELYLDRIPTSVDSGLRYKYRYSRTMVFDEATDTFPFSTAVYQMLVPTVAALWRRERQNSFDADVYMTRLAKAAALLRRVPMRDSYIVQHNASTQYDPIP